MSEERKCAGPGCEARIEQKLIGRPKKFCSPRCKQAFYMLSLSAEKKQRKLEYNKKYYLENAGRLKSRQRDWNARNRKRISDRDKEYYQANAEHCKARQRAWLQRLKQEDPEAYKDHIRGQVERYRKRAASKAISALFFPTKLPTER